MKEGVSFPPGFALVIGSGASLNFTLLPFAFSPLRGTFFSFQIIKLGHLTLPDFFLGLPLHLSLFSTFPSWFVNVQTPSTPPSFLPRANITEEGPVFLVIPSSPPPIFCARFRHSPKSIPLGVVPPHGFPQLHPQIFFSLSSGREIPYD